MTCAFEHSLELKTILDEGDEVKFKSYCLKHSKSKSTEAGLSPARAKPPAEAEKVGLRAQRLQELEEEFYSLTQLDELASDLGLSQQLMDFIYQYWKLKRKANFNKALLPPRAEAENAVLQPHEDNIHTRMRMFMHLRQDLERVRNCFCCRCPASSLLTCWSHNTLRSTIKSTRSLKCNSRHSLLNLVVQVRNLCYMVSRREKLKLLQSKAQEQMFNLHVKLVNQDASAGETSATPLLTRHHVLVCNLGTS